MTQKQSPEFSSNPQTEILNAVADLESQLIVVGEAYRADPTGRQGFIPVRDPSSNTYDVIGGVVEVDEIDPKQALVDGRYPNIRYTTAVYNEVSADTFDGLRATFERDMGRVGSEHRTIIYRVFSDGFVDKIVTDRDSEGNIVREDREFSEKEKSSLMRQLQNPVAVEGLVG